MPDAANGDLLLTSYFVLKLVFAGFWVGWLLASRDVRTAFADVQRGAWIALLALVAGYLFVLQPFVPHGVWQPNNHGAAAAAGLVNGTVPADMMFTHGTGWYVLIYSLHRYLFFGLVSIFTTAYVVSAASLVLLFLVARRLLKSDVGALAAAAILALSPARLRVAATESQAIPVEFFLLASLLAFLLYIDSRRVRFLLLGLAGTALMIQCRLEFHFFAPYLIAALFLAVRPAAVLDPFRSRAGLAAVAAFVAVMTPWVVRLVGSIDPRTGEMSQRVRELLLLMRFGQGDWRVFLSPFFDPRYGPPLYVLLFAAGVIALARRDRRTLLLALGAFLPLTVFYGIYSDSVSTHFRTHAVSLLWVALVAGSGVDALARLARRPAVRAGLLAGLAALFVAGLAPYADFLGQRFSSQVEYDFAMEARERLPAGAVVAALADADDADNSLGRDYQMQMFAPVVGGVPRSVIGLGEFEAKGPSREEGHETFVYLGAPCYVIPRKDHAPDPPADPTYENARCVRVRAMWDLEPVAETTLPGASNGFEGDHIQGEGRPIGLYRVKGRRT